MIDYLTANLPPHSLRAIDVFGYSAQEYLQQDIGIEETEDIAPQSSDERILPENGEKHIKFHLVVNDTFDRRFTAGIFS